MNSSSILSNSRLDSGLFALSRTASIFSSTSFITFLLSLVDHLCVPQIDSPHPTAFKDTPIMIIFCVCIVISQDPIAIRHSPKMTIGQVHLKPCLSGVAPGIRIHSTSSWPKLTHPGIDTLICAAILVAFFVQSLATHTILPLRTIVSKNTLAILPKASSKHH